DRDMKKVLLVIVALLILFFGYGMYASSTPEGKAKATDRNAIDYCWSTHEKKSNSDSQQRFIAGACEKMESDFKSKYGVNP
ncbi:TPA: hypothetical protein ACIK6T_004651, partial [Yersinia enterocolitica]